jgi:Na+/melibiose symporter-like transporter
MAAAGPAAAPAGVSGLPARAAYGLGAAAFGIKDQGFNYLLLIFYNQVLGMPARDVGLAIFIALLIDAGIDLGIGQASDRTRSRWGRRHPWIYAAALPAALAYWALWNPPAGISGAGLFWWLLVLAVLVRATISACEIPSASLVGELTSDYDERTRFLAWRYLLGWMGGIVAGVLAFGLFLAATPEQPVGVLNRDGYRSYATFAATAMLVATLGSALLTHRYIPLLRPAPPRAGAAEILGQARAALANRDFLSILCTGLFSAMATGVSTALNVYVNSYFWGLSTAQQSGLVLSSAAGAILATLFAGRLGQRLGKKTGAVVTFAGAIALSPLLILARQAGLMPENGAAGLLPLLLLHTAVLVTLFVTAAILVTAMLTDTLEANEAATGQRSEGLYFGANFFIQKCVSGLGVLVSGLLIDWIGFAAIAPGSTLPPETATRLVIAYVPAVALCFLAALACLSRYRISRDTHAGLKRLLSGDAPGR